MEAGTVLSESSLADLSTEAAQFLVGRKPAWGAAVIVPGERLVYAANGDEQFETASVVKAFVMLTVLDHAIQEHRFVDRGELELLWPMITESDNDSTTQLWNQLGGGPSLKAYFQRIGVSGIEPYDGPYWGTTLASAKAAALVLARLAFGDILD